MIPYYLANNELLNNNIVWYRYPDLQSKKRQPVGGSKYPRNAQLVRTSTEIKWTNIRSPVVRWPPCYHNDFTSTYHNPKLTQNISLW